MTQSRKILVLGLTMVCGASLAADYTWSNASKDAQAWHALANWTSGGVAATDLPTNAADTVTLPEIWTSDGGYPLRTVNLMKGDNTASIASLSGVAAWQLNLNAYSTSYGYGVVLSFGVGDVNDFKGEWLGAGSKKTLVLNAASGVQTMQVVKVTQQFPVEVANAATTADILQLRGVAGALKKSGPGGLRIRDVAEQGNLVLELEEGDVQIDGMDKALVAADGDGTPTLDDTIVAKSAVWLDASQTNTWLAHAYVDDAGRTRVTNWLDAAGRSARAEIWDNSKDGTGSHLKEILPPFISATRSSTGLAVMDFGASKSENVGTYGPQALMRLHSRIAKAEEVFFVSALNDGAAVLGDSTGTDYNASEDYVFTDGAEIIRDGGFARFNGNRSWQSLRTVSNIKRMARTFDSYTSAKEELMLSNVRWADGNGKSVQYLASDRLYATAGNRSGGVKIGELLIFETALTEDERRQVTAYLMHKWFAKADHKDFHLVNAADATSITVPAGRIARIDTLRVTGTTFTKKGAGTLQIGRVYPEDLTITVEGGDVQLRTSIATEAVTQPVGTPQQWFDAEAENAFDTDGENVTAWCDRRDVTRKTSRYYPDSLTAYPYADTSTLAGHTVLTFPDKSAFQMPLDKYRETFVVFSYTDNILAYNVLSSGYATDRSGGGQSGVFAKYGTAPDEMGGGVYTLNGRPVRPFESTGSSFVKGEWYVANLATTVAYSLKNIASNGPRSNTGNISVAEIITYTTELTPEERRQNIDYLMKKWLGKRHPEYAAPAKNVALSFAGDATVGGEATYAEVTGGGTLTKADSGAVTVTAELTDDFTDLAVQGGTLTITKQTVMTDHSQFHVDAMDTSSYAGDECSYVDDEGRTRVTKWLDTRRNGVYAYKKGVEVGLYVTNPVVEQVVCSDGVTRPFFDFLTFSERNVDPPTGAAMSISPSMGTSCEAVCVYADNVKNSGTIDVFGTTDSNVSYFKRGLNGTLFRTDLAAADVQNGYIWVDGAIGSSSSYVSGDKGDLHVVHIAPANQHAFPMAALGHQGSNGAGGRRYGEYMTFASPLSDKERAYVNGHLMYKWKGATNDAVWTNDFNSLSVASGTTLTVRNGVIAAPTVTGGGTIAAARVASLATLNLAVADRQTVECLTIDGVADFAGAVSVNLLGADADALKPGRYPLVTATSFAHLDLTKWTLEPAQRKVARLVCEGNTVLLEVTPSGLQLLIF